MPLDPVTRLRQLAAEALEIGAGMTDATCKELMLALAASYQRLADLAEERNRASLPSETARATDPLSRVSGETRRPLRS